MLKEILCEAKKFSPLDLGCVKGAGCYFLMNAKFDTNGNWSYMVAKGANKPKKIQHQPNWGSKITKDTTQDMIDNEGEAKTAKQIIDYYIEFKG